MTKPKEWFVADPHFCHRRIVEMARRPFADHREMNEALIRNWNGRVALDDVVRVVGDFACTKRTEEIAPIFHRLNGVKHLVLGNHDEECAETLALPWASITVRDVVNVDSQVICLSHYPMRSWPRARKGAIHLFGHHHGTLRGTDRSLDVGVDCWDYRPVSLPEIRKRLAMLPPDPDFRQDDGDDTDAAPKARF